MKVIARMIAGIVLMLATAGIASAQMGGESTGKGAEKSAEKSAQKPHVIATVTGLDKSNSPKVEEVLKAIQYKNAEGKSLPSVSVVAFDFEKHALHVTVAPGCSLKLSEVEKALEPTKVKIDRNSLGLETACVVKVTSKADADDSAVKEAITEAKIFDSFDVKTTKEATTLEVNIEKSSAKTTCGAFTKAISGAGEYALTEITWTCAASKGETHEKENHGDNHGGEKKPDTKPQG
jgi:hypothetical protein